MAGELSSYSEALPLIREFLITALQAALTRQRHLLKFRKFEKPVDRFFDEVVGEIGLLGPDLAEQVIYVYSNLNAFRMALVMVREGHREMDDVELAERLKKCLEAMERAFSKGATLTTQLRARSAEVFIWSSLRG